MTLEELARALAEQFTTDSTAVLAALQAHANPVYTAVWNSGHKQAGGEGKTKLTELKNQLKELEDEKKELENAVKELREKAPDATKLQADYQREIEALKTKHKGEIDRLKGSVESERKTRTMAELQSKLIAKGVDPDYAKIKVQDADLLSRIRFDDSGSPQVMQPGKDIPYAPADSLTPVDILTNELADATPAKFRTGGNDRGGDARNRGGAGGSNGASGGSGGSGGKNDWGQFRKNVEAERAEKRASGSGLSAADRLAGKRPSKVESE